MGVTRLDAAAATTGGDTQTYTVSAGSNRYLIAIIAGKTNSPTEPTVDYGGQGMTLLEESHTPSETTLVHCWIFGLDEAGIAAASTSVITRSAGSGNNISAASYQDVDQTTPVPQTDSNSTDVNSGPLTTTLTVSDGSALVALCAIGDTGQTVTWSADLTEQTELDAGSGGGMSSIADGLFATGASKSGTSTWSFSSRAAQAMVELAAAAAGIIPEIINHRKQQGFI